MTSHHNPTTTAMTMSEEEEEVLAELKKALNINDVDGGGSGGGDYHSSMPKPLDAISIPVHKNPPVHDTPVASSSSSSRTANNNNKNEVGREQQSINIATRVTSNSNYMTSGTFKDADDVADDDERVDADRDGEGDGHRARNRHDSKAVPIVAVIDDDIDDQAREEDEEEDDIHLLQEGADDMTYDELLELVERLYKNLKQADAALTNERTKRTGREKSLIKLAKELRSRKDKINELEEQIDDLEEDLRVVRSERTALEQRLDRFIDNERQGRSLDGPSREELQEALRQERQRYELSRLDHEKRVQELKQRHADQCEALCREILKANREGGRVQKQLENDRRMSFGTSETSSPVTVEVEDGDQLSDLLSFRLQSPVRTSTSRSVHNVRQSTKTNFRQQSHDALRPRGVMVLLALFSLGLAVVGQLENFKIGEMMYFFRGIDTKILFSRQDNAISTETTSRYPIHQMMISPRSHPTTQKDSPIFKEGSPVSTGASSTVEEILPSKGYTETEKVPEVESTNGLFDGMHKAIQKIGRLIRKAWMVVISIFKKLFETV